MARIFNLTKMPSGDFRMLLCDDGIDEERRDFKNLLDEDFYGTTVLIVTNLMRPGKTPEEFMDHVMEQNPGSSWIELGPRVWLWKAASAPHRIVSRIAPG